MPNEEMQPFVSRAGLKLDHALKEFKFGVTGFICADFGCNVGGFTDCLLKRGAKLVYALDTGYGVLDYRLRTDDRVVVMERTNALHSDPPEACNLVVIDLAWTPQRLAVAAALKWLKADGRIITLIKPHYELSEEEKRSLLVDGRLEPAEAERVMQRVLDDMPALGAEVIDHTLSPITGGKTSRKKKGAGNIEYLALLKASAARRFEQAG
jgi:23S rRNA (cytidine1920-2'-O)/16S rRNA (cytidine1409-2'-O)-methyltransferase